jgi:glutamyl-tRNA synthetase
VLGRDGQRLAKRHGAVTLADQTPSDALAWMAVSLNLAEAGERLSAKELLDRFGLDRIPREPTVFVTSS